MAVMAGMAERQKEWQNGRIADGMVKWQTEWQNSWNGGRNGQMVGMVEWREWRTEWSNGRQKWLHTYYIWYTPTTPTTTMTTMTMTPFNLLYYRRKQFANWNVCYFRGFDVENGHTSLTCPAHLRKASHDVYFTR